MYCPICSQELNSSDELFFLTNKPQVTFLANEVIGCTNCIQEMLSDEIAVGSTCCNCSKTITESDTEAYTCYVDDDDEIVACECCQERENDVVAVMYENDFLGAEYVK